MLEEYQTNMVNITEWSHMYVSDNVKYIYKSSDGNLNIYKFVWEILKVN